jgi:hypothetical protein
VPLPSCPTVSEVVAQACVTRGRRGGRGRGAAPHLRAHTRLQRRMRELGWPWPEPRPCGRVLRHHAESLWPLGSPSGCACGLTYVVRPSMVAGWLAGGLCWAVRAGGIVGRGLALSPAPAPAPEQSTTFRNRPTPTWPLHAVLSCAVLGCVRGGAGGRAGHPHAPAPEGTRTRTRTRTRPSCIAIVKNPPWAPPLARLACEQPAQPLQRLLGRSVVANSVCWPPFPRVSPCTW